MLVKPNTAFTGVPSGRVIGGRAWKARKINPDPSIRIRCSFRVGVSAEISPAISPGISMSAVVVRSWVQDIETRAIRAHHLFARDAQEDPRVTESTVPAIASDGARVYMDDLGRCHLVSRHG
jgi:hypothetical protein